MFKYLSKRLFHSTNETSQKINTQTKAKIGIIQSIRNKITSLKMTLTPPLNYRIKFRNLLPNRYPLTSILIGLNLYK